MRSRILDMLESETRTEHDAANAQALAFVEKCTREHVRDYLVRSYGFEAALESACVMAPCLASHSATSRARTRYIAHDLAELGWPIEKLLEVETCPLPPLRDPAQALGWLYVAERNVTTNTLGYQVLYARDPELAALATYLNCYGTSSLARWRAFAISFMRASAGVDPERVTTTAVASYRRLRSWLYPSRGRLVICPLVLRA